MKQIEYFCVRIPDNNEEEQTVKKFFSFILILALVFSLCACASKDKSAQMTVDEVRPVPAAAPVFEEYSMAADSVAYEAPAQKMSLSNGAAGAVKGAGSTAPTENPDKIIYSADATVETTAFDETLAKIDELIEQYGGWVESSSISGANYYNISRGHTGSRNASYTLRIPSEAFDEVMSGLSALGNVPYSHVYTENVTAQYYDTQARLDSFKTQEQSLLKLMEKAESVEDIITIESKLAEVRYSIESLQSSLNNWDRRVSYSTVYLSVEEVAEYTPETVVKPSFGQKLVKAVKDGFSTAGEVVSGFVLWLLEALPTLILVSAVIFGAFLLIRSAVRKRKAKKAEKKDS